MATGSSFGLYTKIDIFSCKRTRGSRPIPGVAYSAVPTGLHQCTSVELLVNSGWTKHFSKEGLDTAGRAESLTTYREGRRPGAGERANMAKWCLSGSCPGCSQGLDLHSLG